MYSFRLSQHFPWLTSLYFCVSLKRLSKIDCASRWQQSDFVEQITLLKAGFCFQASGKLKNACQVLDTLAIHQVVSLVPFQCPKSPTVIGKNSESTTFHLSAGSWMGQNLKAEAVSFHGEFHYSHQRIGICGTYCSWQWTLKTSRLGWSSFSFDDFLLKTKNLCF